MSGLCHSSVKPSNIGEGLVRVDVSFRSFLCAKENGHKMFLDSFFAPKRSALPLATIGTQEWMKNRYIQGFRVSRLATALMEYKRCFSPARSSHPSPRSSERHNLGLCPKPKETPVVHINTIIDKILVQTTISIKNFSYLCTDELNDRSRKCHR